MKNLLLLLCFFSLMLSAQEQPPTGFWSIAQVTVGEEIMTPVARWTKISEDGTFTSGNGWLQNMKGTWSWNGELAHYAAHNTLGIADEFGPFTVTRSPGKMTWTRMEDDMKVVVHLEATSELPMAPSDYLQGMWELTAKDKSEDPAKIFFRWDRIYLSFAEDGTRSTGYWHIHGHRPHITMLPHTDGMEPESWKIEANEGSLIMVGISDANRDRTLTFRRIDSF